MQPESIEQIKICEWLKNKTDLFFFMPVNQGRRTVMDGLILKRMGLVAGVFDLFIMRQTKSAHGAFLEVKTLTGKPSKHQLLFQKMAHACNYEAEFCYGAEHGIEIIKKWYGL